MKGCVMRSLLLFAGLVIPTVAAAQTVTWWTVKGDPGKVDMWMGSQLLGTLDPFEGTWKGTDGKAGNLREFAFKENPPRRTGDLPGGRSATPTPKAGICECEDCGPDCECGCRGAGARNRDNGPRPLFGVDRGRVREAERFTIGGKEISRAEAMSALETAADIPDDAGKVRLTVIGSAAARKPIMEDLKTAPALAYWRGQFVVKDYPADHWRIKDGGFKVPAKSTDAVVYVQKPDGTVLWRQDTYTGADALAKALRDKVPGYDPAKDPQPSNPGPILPDLSGHDLNYWWLAVPAASGLVILFRRWV